MNSVVGSEAALGFGRTLGLWSGWLIGPLAWAGQFLVAYLLVPKASNRWGLMPFHLTTVAGLLGTALSGWLAWRAWVSARERGVGWTRFMAILGLATAPLFAVVILSQWAAVELLDPLTR